MKLRCAIRGGGTRRGDASEGRKHVVDSQSFPSYIILYDCKEISSSYKGTPNHPVGQNKSAQKYVHCSILNSSDTT
jgi:hypothetical protein